jgi:hypothetical protein
MGPETITFILRAMDDERVFTETEARFLAPRK